MTVDVFKMGNAVYETEEDVAEKASEWDELRIEYLLASLPPAFIESCAIECEALAAKFDLQIELSSKPIQPGQLQTHLEDIADKLTASWGEPGSETLGILIALTRGN